MTDTIIETKLERRENTVLHFPPNQHYDAIKAAIVKQCQQKNQKKRLVPRHHNDHIGGLPSPPVEDKKVTPEPEEEVVMEEVLPTSVEIKERIKRLTDEKHRLFQLLKQLMLQEEQNKKRQQLQQQQKQQQQLHLQQQQLHLQQQQQQQQHQLQHQQQLQQQLQHQHHQHHHHQQQQQQQNQHHQRQQYQQQQHHHQKKKSRWAPVSSCDHPSYFYPRPRYQPYNTNQPQRNHYPLPRPPYSR